MLLKACLNGGTTRDAHPAVPQTPAELAADAAAVIAAGAGAVHLHPRDASGAETLEADSVLAAVAAVRAAISAPVGVTTGLWAAGGDPARRMSLVARWDGADRPDFASVNLSEPGADELAALLASHGIAVEAGIWTTDGADRLAASSFGRQVIRILVLHHSYGPATWSVLRAAVRLGRDIRVGLEDTVVLPDGRPAGGNRELVQAALRLASES
jgi:uncharacterized protein (DUF849 family)